MRFVAGRGAVAERLQRSGAVAEMLAAAWRIAIGKKLLPGRAIGKLLPARGAVAELLAVSAMAKRMAAPWRRAIGKLLLARALQRSSIGKKPLPERRATARKVRKGVRLPARRDCMEQRVGLFF